jgi:hypothetical protein
MSDWKYPDDVATAIEIRGVYDGVCIWVLNDGRWINRFEGDGGRREQAIDRYIAEHGSKEAGF